jgi:DNA polymerase I-like protein with 3'-5' exonuclease and polymerase domains
MNPISLLPIEHPIKYDPSIGNISYFYDNVVQHLINDINRVSLNGIPIDLDKVKELETTVVNVLDIVATKLASNQIILDFHAQLYPKKFKAFKEEQEAKKRTVDYYMLTYNNSVLHRTYVVNEYLKMQNKLLVEKASIKTLKELNSEWNNKTIDLIINNKCPKALLDKGMLALATHKLVIYNKSIDTKIKEVGREKILPKFNPGSSLQLRELFASLRIKPLKYSKTSGEASWDRSSIEQILKTTKDKKLKEVLQLFIDHSYSSIIKNNFIKAFKNYTINGVLYGNYKLGGTKTWRLTSNSPNLLQMPSTGSIYAEPLKKCLIAPKGTIILTADFNALEDRVIANLSGDMNKLAIFTEGLDGHSLAATYYFKVGVTKLIGEYTDHKDASRQLKALVDAGDKKAKQIRQEGKPITFGLSYGSYPPKVAETIGCSIEEATLIFNTYHEDMFPGISKFRSVISDKVQTGGYNHLGLGCRIYSDDVNKDVRTLFNSSSQFWSILSLLAINKMHTLIDEAGYTEDIKCISTIYDSIYYTVTKDATIIKWLNDNLIEVMSTDFLIDQEVPNTAESDIGYNWNDLKTIPNNTSIEKIKMVIKELDEKI